MKYYHYAPIPLAAGSIIEPGNWGRLTLQERDPLPLLDLSYEYARCLYNPSAPSRLECCFVFPSLQAAEEFSRANTGHQRNILYEVSPVNLGALIYKTKWNLFGLNKADNINILKQSISDYWNFDQKNPDCNEVLIGGAIRIAGKIE